ncbi:MAG: Jag N-terminal domain-containing protein [Clostridia bacterium]|nr:Jag N-terminal domain-containing protein [Clostridia bacterium]MBQ4296756.1 Jag N-terminal domain-containing protein [Clostridia bacterium]
MEELKDFVATGETVQEALENAKKQLGVEDLAESGYDFTVVADARKGGFLGLKKLPAEVRVYRVEEKAEEKAEEKPEKPAREGGKFQRDFFSPQKKQQGEPAARPQQERNRGPRPQQSRPQQPQKQRAPLPEAKPMPTVAETAPELQNEPALLFVRRVLSDLELSARAEMILDGDGMRRIVVYGEDATLLIGHHGETLDGFQYLANLAQIRAKKEAGENRVTIDIENYRAKREEALRALARRMASKAKKYRRSVTLEPMTPYERRIIHSEVQGIEGVTTRSVGAENNRKVVISLSDGRKPEDGEETATEE